MIQPDYTSPDGRIKFYNCSYEELFKMGKIWDLANCDIPYGTGVGKMAYLTETKTRAKQKNGNKLNANANKKGYKLKDWDNEAPPQAYFDKIKKCCKEQIIFGVEYVDWTGLGNGRIKWNKGVAEGMSFKKYEMAYCSLIDCEVELDLLWAGMCQAKSLAEPMTQQGNKKLNETRIHPTQKPILLHKRLILDYMQKGWNILNTHGGCCGDAIAVHDINAALNMNLTLDICEIDTDYFNDAVKRFRTHLKRQRTQFGLNLSQDKSKYLEKQKQQFGLTNKTKSKNK